VSSTATDVVDDSGRRVVYLYEIDREYDPTGDNVVLVRVAMLADDGIYLGDYRAATFDDAVKYLTGATERVAVLDRACPAGWQAVSLSPGQRPPQEVIDRYRAVQVEMEKARPVANR
jgi:hypothetical protein